MCWWRRPGSVVWLVTWLVAMSVQVAPRFVATGGPYGTPQLLFWVVVVAAALCVGTSAAVMARAWRQDTGELALHSAFFMAVSLLPLAHGLTTPSVLYGPNSATSAAALVGLPLAVVAQLPLLAPRRLGTALLRRWRPWVIGQLVVQLVAFGSLLVFPNALPAVGTGSAAAIALALPAVAATVAVSARHLRLYWIGRSPGSLGVALGYSLVGSAHLVWLGAGDLSTGFWIAHGLDVAGVFAGTILAFGAYRRGALDQELLAPLVAREPLQALELGLDPTVRRFMIDLGTKDRITQDHVRRTAETALVVGARLGLDAPELRAVGLGALLHDVGKLEIADEILQKPGRLTAEEFELVKHHTVAGERLVKSSQVLSALAPIVRHHHERIDGRGYPDGLRGQAIPRLARIVSVCDAYDAMVHTRQYREGMGVERAVAILQEHAGSQWDPEVVAALLDASDRGEIPDAPTLLASVQVQVGCSCTHELPPPTASVGGPSGVIAEGVEEAVT